MSRMEVTMRGDGCESRQLRDACKNRRGSWDVPRIGELCEVRTGSILCGVRQGAQKRASTEPKLNGATYLIISD